MSYRDFTPGIRYAITWLHKRANEMNDPKAKQILDSAAFNLGVEHSHKRAEFVLTGSNEPSRVRNENPPSA